MAPDANPAHDPNYNPEDYRVSLPVKFLVVIPLIAILLLANVVFFRIHAVLNREKPGAISPRPKPSKQHPTHLLVVLGSGGHTAEMLSMLGQIPSLSTKYTHRTYIVSSGDGFSASKAAEFEREICGGAGLKNEGSESAYDIVTVRRARKVHQSYITAPFSVLRCINDCLKALRGKHPDQKGDQHGYPDLILTNGPGTGVCVVVASIILLCFGFSGPLHRSGKEGEQAYHDSGKMRTIFVESWARVEELSSTGTLLLPVVDRFLVQWPRLAYTGTRAEYLGPLVA